MPSPLPMLVLGAGYTGRRILARTLDRPVVATTRSATTCAELSAAAAHPRSRVVRFDPSAANAPAWPALFDTHVDATVCWPPTHSSTDDHKALRRALQTSDGQGVRRAIYLSATSVYGASGGEVVDADDAVGPDSERGQRRLRHEEQFLSVCVESGVDAVILRLPGIYGPGRSGAERILTGTWRLADGGTMFSNRIHVDDIVSAVLCLADAPRVSGPYIAVDDHPFAVVDLAAFSSRALGAPMPASVPLAELPESVRSFWTGDRRLSNTKLRSLGWAPVYSSYREGLPQAWAEDGTRFSLSGSM